MGIVDVYAVCTCHEQEKIPTCKYNKIMSFSVTYFLGNVILCYSCKQSRKNKVLKLINCEVFWQFVFSLSVFFLAFLCSLDTMERSILEGFQLA